MGSRVFACVHELHTLSRVAELFQRAPGGGAAVTFCSSGVPSSFGVDTAGCGVVLVVGRGAPSRGALRWRWAGEERVADDACLDVASSSWKSSPRTVSRDEHGVVPQLATARDARSFVCKVGCNERRGRNMANRRRDAEEGAA